jgi:diguanylate cyclase (GGDEF)-like protein
VPDLNCAVRMADEEFVRTDQHEPASVGRVFVYFAALMLVVVAAMGAVLGTSLRAGAEGRALTAAHVGAQIMAASSIEPALDGRPASANMDPAIVAGLQAVTDRLTSEGQVLRLRLRSPDGRVVFSDDGSGLGGPVDDEALEAAEGHVEVHLTRLNSDDDDSGAVGPRAVEVYQPLGADSRLGVLEVYMPYAPIAEEVQSGLRHIYRDLAIGLGMLYLVLVGLALTTMRRLRQSARRNAYLANHDPLTDLPNRRAFLREIDRIAADPGRTGGAVAVIDMDRFKEVNDSLGHHNGDALLLALTVRLRAAIGHADVVARLGGDEFGLVLTHVRDGASATRVLGRVLRELKAPLQLSGIAIAPEASAGFALIGSDGEDGTALLRRADIALYTAKARDTGGVVAFEVEQDHYDPDRLAMVGELGRAMAEDELVLHFQPKLDLGTGAVVGAEALLRWQHPRHGLLYPDAFLPLAEQTGLIDPLTEWVLDHALGQLRSLGLPRDARMSVNISARNLGHPQFAARVLDALGRRGIEPRRLVLELTETAVFADVRRATAVLEELSAAGVAISLDDFGQGQTSIGHLANLHVRELKIDRAYVRDMLTDHRHCTIVRSLVELAHNLALTVVAEGVEDDQTRAALQDMGCDEGQGYGLARPMPAGKLVEWLQRHEVEQALLRSGHRAQ